MRVMYIVAPTAEAIAAELSDLPAGFAVRTWPDFSFLANGQVDADVEALVAFPHVLTQDIIDSLPGLRWFQALSTGIDPLSNLTLPRVTISTMGGVQGPQMSELAFQFMLNLARDIRGMIGRQADHQWGGAPPPPLLIQSKLVIVGVGRIAVALARRAKAFEMEVIGVSSSRTEAPHFDQILPIGALGAAAAQADFLLVLAPYSPANHHLISRDVIAAMRPGSFLINLARGRLVDEDALIDALAAGTIGGAGLDVFTQEPLPPESPLWDMPNVLISPHLGGWSTQFVRQVSPIIEENARRWFGPRQPLLNEITN